MYMCMFVCMVTLRGLPSRAAAALCALESYFLQRLQWPMYVCIYV